MALEERNRLIHHYYLRALREVAPLMSGRMLDIGCGEKPYETMFAPYVAEHIGLEHPDCIHDSRAELMGTAYSIPAGDESFDSAICTAVLEHLEEPAQALREARRVLKPGGRGIYAAPLFWQLHEAPRDFYRYTEYGLRHLFERANFEVEEVRPLAGFWVTSGQMLVNYLYGRFPSGLWRSAVPPVGLLVQALAAALHRLDNPSPKWTWGYLAVVRAA